MEYRKLGKWGMKVRCGETQSRSLVKIACEAGVNYFDTSTAYAGGQAEFMLGKIFRDYPPTSLVLLTRVWTPMGPGPNDRGLSARHIREQCHASLKR